MALKMKRKMKRVVLFIGMTFMSLMSEQMLAQQGIGTLEPDKSAALEVVSTKRGILLPRIDIPDLNAATPVQNPAHSLLVFNTGASGTPEGFYYWNDDGTQTGIGSWELFGESSTGSLEDITITGGDNIEVSETTVGGIMNYEISLEPGINNGQLLVTVIDDSDPQNPIASAVWEDASVVFSDLLEGANAIRLEPEVDVNNIPTGVSLIKLGGVLSETTEIRTGWDEDLAQAESSHTLAITGLEAVAVTNKLLVVENDSSNDGVLRTLDRSFSRTISSTEAIDQLAGYSAYIPEIHLLVDVLNLNSDINLTLPDPSLTEGQVITISLTDSNGTGEPDNYLNIFENDGITLLTYGAIPYQAWILKSDGTNWSLAGRF